MTMMRRRELSAEDPSIGSASSRSSAYAGPTPLGQDGLPLRSCLSSSRRRRRCRAESDGYESDSTICTAALSADSEGEQEQSVSFGAIEMRKYERALGDHPCVSSGAPVTLGWKYNQYGSVSVDEYERARGPVRQREQLRIPREERVQILLCDVKASLRDVKDAELSALRVREDMAKSLNRAKTPAYGQLDEMKETAKRRLRRIVRGTWKKEEEELWRNAHDVAVGKFQEARHPLMMSISIPCAA
uniref:Uncharacterized protein n=1 Tax=Ditylum brightwellii TaxID=49249 RepID=A0A6V2CGB7_9STRA|mmetsp:Transcript_8579/g.12803  ORF Transcript_8579/g.12803 Transcript_8579/m.12803 type:complete len:245 (+) Transcript_8579:144-878(+)|eukprot:1218790-Ditylum_brightwellii.AAC.1